MYLDMIVEFIDNYAIHDLFFEDWGQICCLSINIYIYKSPLMIDKRFLRIQTLTLTTYLDKIVYNCYWHYNILQICSTCISQPYYIDIILQLHKYGITVAQALHYLRLVGLWLQNSFNNVIT